MIRVHVHDADDEELARIWMREAPAVDSHLWFSGCEGEALRAKFETTSFRVVEVAHWVVTGWEPNTHVGEPIHSVCVYVAPNLPKKGEQP